MIPPTILTALVAAGRVTGQVVLGLLTTLLMGKTFRDLLAAPLGWIARKTGTRSDDRIVADVRADWGLEPDPRLQPTETADSKPETAGE